MNKGLTMMLLAFVVLVCGGLFTGDANAQGWREAINKAVIETARHKSTKPILTDSDLTQAMRDQLSFLRKIGYPRNSSIFKTATNYQLFLDNHRNYCKLVQLPRRPSYDALKVSNGYFLVHYDHLGLPVTVARYTELSGAYHLDRQALFGLHSTIRNVCSAPHFKGRPVVLLSDGTKMSRHLVGDDHVKKLTHDK